jgi:iron complex transport system permease protein
VRSNNTIFWFACFVLAALMALALLIGTFPISPSDLAGALWAKVVGARNAAPENVEAVIFDIRAPRIVAAVLTGAALAAAGAAYQGMFRNPLVSPDILGVSAGASLGAVMAIFLALPALAVQGFAFGGGLLAVAFVYLVGRAVRGHDPVLSLILSGVAVGTLFGSGIALVKYLADPFNELPAITFWLLGSLATTSPEETGWLALFIVVSIAPLFLLRWRINLLSLSDDEARALGVNVDHLRFVVILAATLMTASAVAI